MMVFGEGLGRLLGDPEIETEHLTTVAVAGFCVNLIGSSRCSASHDVNLIELHTFGL
jgi:Co/Zn/Cd efflux system component